MESFASRYAPPPEAEFDLGIVDRKEPGPLDPDSYIGVKFELQSHGKPGPVDDLHRSIKLGRTEGVEVPTPLFRSRQRSCAERGIWQVRPCGKVRGYRPDFGCRWSCMHGLSFGESPPVAPEWGACECGSYGAMLEALRA